MVAFKKNIYIYMYIYIYTLEVQRPLTKKHVFTKDYFHVENFNRPKLGTIILIVFDFQGVYMYIYVYIHPGFHLSQNPGFQPIASSLSKHYPPQKPSNNHGQKSAKMRMQPTFITPIDGNHHHPKSNHSIFRLQEYWE